MTRQSVITWIDVAAELPDADTNVLLAADGDAENDAGTCEGFLHGHDSLGLPLFCDVTGWPVHNVSAWSALPAHPGKAAQ